MSSTPQFLVIDDHPDNRFLLTKTLIRKYPGALIQECQDSAAALLAAKRPGLTAVVVHRSSDVEGVPLVAMLRQENPAVPILFVSGVDRRSAAFAAGANAYLNYDAWLRVGTVVEDLLKTGSNPPLDPSN